MKTAVLISGHARTFQHTFANQYWQVLRHFEDPHFFVSIVNDDDAATMELLKSRFFAGKVSIERVTQPDLPEPAGSPQFHAPAPIKGTVQGILRQLWHLRRVYEFAGLGEDFSCIVRLRPDLWFHRFTMPRFDLLNLQCITPWWGSYGGINDRFAIMGDEAAGAYFNTYRDLDTLIGRGCPLHPESLLAAQLETNSVYITRSLNTEFSTLRRQEDGRCAFEWPHIETYDVVSYLRSTR